ncbi:unnamed protein product [Heligmosomoides polygyrus]|uniref:RNA polymerase II-associated protein 3 n=1 Tax=Heligmosomoides polygyrus TaxID=6339 RepID=A0A3P7WU08_HELPZ|nr:unnamed protein product [Heligmosomoides polygyrus]
MSTEAMRLKEEGNICFREKRYHKAIDFYTQSLQVELLAAVLGNRAQCYLNLERWSEAIMDCNKALELDPKFGKALYRRAQALKKIGLKSSAVEDLDRCLQIAPNTAVKTMMEELLEQRNADVVQISCVEKGDEVRSDSEFVEIGFDVPQTSKKDDQQSAIPIHVYNTVFGELLEADVIGRLLQGFVSLLETKGIEPKEVSTCLLSLSDLPRFQLLSMFFGDEEKKDLIVICGFLQHSDSVTIRERYRVEETSEE